MIPNNEITDEQLLPHIPDGEEIKASVDANDYKEVKDLLLNPRENYPEPFCMLEYMGVPFSAIGGIQALTGQKKNGKTFLETQLMAAILMSGEECNLLPGLKVPERTLEHLGHEPRVLYVDTEMEKLYSAKVLRRVHYLCGWDMTEPHERFNVLWLRNITRDDNESVSHKKFRLIKQAIDYLKPDAVFIDGLRDIVEDFNDNAESGELLSNLMALASQKNICIWNVLHMNPSLVNTAENKMRGALGSELANKVTDTLVSIKHKKNGMVWFSVSQPDARGEDMKPWEFIITKDAGNLGVPAMKNREEIEKDEDYAAQQARIEADDIFKQFAWTNRGATYTELLNWFNIKCGIRSNRKIKDYFDSALEAGIILKKEKKYFYNGLKDIPDDKSAELPFEKPNKDEVPF